MVGHPSASDHMELAMVFAQLETAHQLELLRTHFEHEANRRRL